MHTCTSVILNVQRPEELTVLCDFFPRVWWVHESCILDLVINVLIFVEGEGAREGDVRNHSNRPHVQGPVVTLVAQDLRSCKDSSIRFWLLLFDFALFMCTEF